MVVIIVAKDALPDERSEARSLLLVHRPEAKSGGLCRGCYESACHFAWWPCPQARWAQRVVEANDGGVQGMRPLLSPALANNAVARQRVYTALLAEPDRDWTLSAIAQSLPDVAVIEVQATLNMLLGDRLLDTETVGRQRPLKVRLTGEGQQMLAAILRSWEMGGLEQDAPAARERDAQ